MHRPRHSWWLLLTPVLVVLAMSVAGCGGSEHDMKVRKFFAASAANDVATIGNVATVSFDPNKDGRAQNVTFVSQTPEQTRVLALKDLDKAYKEAQAKEADYAKRMKEYQDQNSEAIARILKIENSGKGKVTGKDVAIQTAWTKWREDGHEVQKALSDARKALQSERRVADLSLPELDASTYAEAVEATTEVTYTANVRSADNKVAKKTLILTLQRVVLKDDAGKVTEGNWMITGIKEGAAAQ